MGLFSKKHCDVCGGDIGFLGNRKLEDGNLCKTCAAKLSPWFSERRQSTVEEIKAQLEYREQNKAAVAAFHTTRTLGIMTKVLLDEDNRKFMVTGASKLADANPDVMDYSQITGCRLDIEDYKDEITREGPDGKQISYNPPRYSYTYNFYMVLNVNHPYFNEIRFKLNNSDVTIEPGVRPLTRPMPGRPILPTGTPDPRSDPEYARFEQMGEEIKAALLGIHQETRDAAAAANAPVQAVHCPWCGATTTPDATGCCEYCGGSLNG